ncbi:MAG: hypothetical protein QOF77_1565 [Solirubrobacteraceae bacterium]|nr:hypothetical protein [Solirubrobacteraceae bacterium]
MCDTGAGRGRDAALRSLLVCPGCGGTLVWDVRAARCPASGHAYPITDGVPLLLADVAHDEHKARQADFFDAEDAQFERTRPHGAPAMYGWLLHEKFARATVAIAGTLRGATAVASCGGSGMDAEFLARAGARVISVDLSLGAARGARARAARYGLAILSVVGDAERLPIATEGVGVAYVHDGLHHLADPYVGLRELTRVARRAVSVTEPCRAALTRVAVRAGLAYDEEEAGNRVGRMELDRIRGEFSAAGFDTVHAERYGMFYRQHPGRPMHACSRRRVRPLAERAVLAANRVGGHLGNKLTVQAVRVGTSRRGDPGGRAL